MSQPSPASDHDERFMRLALALGARHLGLTWPNPSVGAVVVDTSGAVPVIVSQACTQPGGRPHAERVALTEAGERARGATLYVSLEPCSHHGRSPPCVDAILDQRGIVDRIRHGHCRHEAGDVVVLDEHFIGVRLDDENLSL